MVSGGSSIASSRTSVVDAVDALLEMCGESKERQ